MRKTSWVAAAVAGSVILSGSTRGDTDPRLQEFAAQKHKQMEALAAKLHLDVPPQALELFKAAEAGDCLAVSNAYARLQQLSSPSEGSHLIPGLTNVLYVPIHETWGAYEFCDWNPALLEQYAGGILGSMSTNSVYFGGTDPGRFVITMFSDARESPIAVLTPKFVITQNALVDTRYLEYLRLTQGDRLWLPSTNDVGDAFQQCVSDMRKRQQKGEQLGPDEQVDSAGRIRGVVAVMNLNGMLARKIFDHNKQKHPFFVEESYVIAWMYPYMEPHGLILKLNNEPLKELDPAVMAQDRKFWDGLSKELLADPRFLGNESARKAYSKMRSSIGGLYVYRHLTDEAEAVFKQALELYPASPEANFRLAQLYMDQGHSDKAIRVLERFQKRDPLNDKISAAIQQLRNAPHKAGASQ